MPNAEQTQAGTFTSFTVDLQEGRTYTFRQSLVPIVHPKRIVLSEQAYVDMQNNGITKLAEACTEFLVWNPEYEKADAEFEVGVDDSNGEVVVTLDVDDWIVMTTGMVAHEKGIALPRTEVLYELPEIVKKTPVWRTCDYGFLNSGHAILQSVSSFEIWEARKSRKANSYAVFVDAVSPPRGKAHDGIIAVGVCITGRFTPKHIFDVVKTQYGETFAYYNEQGRPEFSNRINFSFSPDSSWESEVSAESDYGTALISSPNVTALFSGSDEEAEKLITNTLIEKIMDDIANTATEVEAADTAAQEVATQVAEENNPLIITTSNVYLQTAAVTTVTEATPVVVVPAAPVGRHGTDVSRLLAAGMTGNNHRKDKKAKPTTNSYDKKLQPKAVPKISTMRPQSQAAGKYLDDLKLPNSGIDGEDHINASASGITQLGRFLDINREVPFEYARVGRINSIGGLWVFLSTPPEERTEQLLAAHGQVARKQAARLQATGGSYSQPGFKVIIADATMAKILSRPDMTAAFMRNPLPFQMYHLDDVTGERRTHLKLAAWYLPVLEHIRDVLNARKDRGLPLNPVAGEETVEADFTFLESAPNWHKSNRNYR